MKNLIVTCILCPLYTAHSKYFVFILINLLYISFSWAVMPRAVMLIFLGGDAPSGDAHFSFGGDANGR